MLLDDEGAIGVRCADEADGLCEAFGLLASVSDTVATSVETKVGLSWGAGDGAMAIAALMVTVKKVVASVGVEP